MNCPKCGLLMEEGTMHTQKYPFWTQQELRFFRSPTDVVKLAPRVMTPPVCSRGTRFRNFPPRCSAGRAAWSHFHVI